MHNTSFNFSDFVAHGANVNMRERQKPLHALYQCEPEQARIVDCAKTSSAQVPASTALYGEVLAGGNNGLAVPVGVHTAVGGESDFPVPGEILCAAIAACLDSCIRIMANRVGVELTLLQVTAEASVDVRGTLCMDDKVPVGFQDLQLEIDIQTKEEVPAARMDAILKAAEYSCIVLQTLRSSPSISITRAPSRENCIAA